MHRHLISYPKSGRTWLRYSLTLLKVADQVRFRHEGSEFKDVSCPQRNFDHDARLERYSNLDRIVYLSRDSRDIMLSLYFQITGRMYDKWKYQGSKSEFIRDDYFGAMNLHKFCHLWERLCAEGYAMRITYEDCHRDFLTVLEKVMMFYEFDCAPDRLRQASNSSTFDTMKSVELSGSFPCPWLRPRNNALKMRRGVIGGFRDGFSEDDIEYMNSVFGLM